MITLYTLNLYNVVYQLHVNKTRRKKIAYKSYPVVSFSLLNATVKTMLTF